jgi:hypothetical protein
MSSPSPHPAAAAFDSPVELEHPYYFIHPQPPIATLVFIRERHGGARILGGRSGSHRTGHGESWWEKFSEVISLGYLPVEIARDRGIISTEWQPPKLEQ